MKLCKNGMDGKKSGCFFWYTHCDGNDYRGIEAYRIINEDFSETIIFGRRLSFSEKYRNTHHSLNECAEQERGIEHNEFNRRWWEGHAPYFSEWLVFELTEEEVMNHVILESI